MRYIENCLTAFSGTVYPSGIKQPIPRSTLADANERRDWSIYAAFAQVLIRKARPLCFDDKEFRLDMDNVVCAFDSTTIDLCLSLYPWAKFHQQKGAAKMHTLLDLRGYITVFVDITEGAVHDINVLDKNPVEPGSYSVMVKGDVDFHRLYSLIHQCRAFYVTRAKENLRCKIISSGVTDQLLMKTNSNA